MSVVVGPHRFSVEDYHRMGEVGILTEQDRVVRPGDQLAPAALPDVSLDVAAILA